MKEFLWGTSILGVWAVMGYAFYWVIKSVSYWLFYEDMVIQTVIDTMRAQGVM